MKHLLDVTGEGNFFLLESGKDANQGVKLVWSLKQVLFYGLVLVDGAAVEHNADLIWFPWMIDIEVWEIPRLALCCLQLVYGNLKGMAVIEDLFHKG